jgi:hypothetical protein
MFSLDVTSSDGTLRASKTVSIKSTSPKILLYTVNPLLGTIYNKSLLNDSDLIEAETTIKIESYFFNKKDIKYYWSINDDIPTLSKDNKNELVVRVPSTNVGESLLNILVNSPYQSVQKSIRLKFGRVGLGF